MTWREISADQNLRLVSKMLEQQGQLNALNERIRKIREIVKIHRNCDTGCDALPDIEDVINDAD